MKKVLFVIPTMRMGGAEKALVSLLRSLDPERLGISLLLFETGGVLQQEIPSHVEIIEADPITRGMVLELRCYIKDMIRLGYYLAALDRFRISLRSKRGKKQFAWDTIRRHIPELQGHYDVAIGFLEGFTDFYVIDKVNADRKIGWIHTEMSNSVQSGMESKYYLQFDRIVTITELCKKAFLNIYPEACDKIEVIENIVSSEDVLKKAETPIDSLWDKDTCRIVTVGRLEYVKGIDIAVKACAKVKEKGYDITWHVFGEGSIKKELERLIKKLKLEDCFILEGLTANPYPYMKKADIIVQSSRNEGKSIVLDEAKILGKAIVVTRYSSVFDQIRDGETGIITDFTPESLASGIIRLIEELSFRRLLEQNCRKDKTQSDITLNLVYKLIEGNRGEDFVEY